MFMNYSHSIRLAHSSIHVVVSVKVYDMCVSLQGSGLRYCHHYVHAYHFHCYDVRSVSVISIS